MNFQIILSNFKEYLELKSNVYDPKEANIDYQKISIFDYKDEFKEFLKENYNYNLSNTAGMIEELKGLQIIDGELVDPSKLSEEDKKKHESIPVEQNEFDQAMAEKSNAAKQTNSTQAAEGTQEATEQAPVEEDIVKEDSLSNYSAEKGVNIEGADFVTAVLNEFLKDEDFRKAIDKNSDGKIDETDIEAFLDVIKCYDEQPDNISLDDLLMAADDIQEGTFRYLTDKEIETAVTENGALKTENADEIGLSPNQSGRNVTAGSIGTPEKPPIQREDGTYIPENMSDDKLSATESDLGEKITENKKDLADAINDVEGQKLKEAMNKALDSYQDAISKIDKDLAQEIESVRGKIAAKEEEITKNENNITETNDQINTHKQKINECDAKITSLNNAKASVQRALANAKDEDKGNYSKQLAEIDAQIKEAESAKTEAEKAKKEAEEKLAKLEENKGVLQEDLNKLKNELADCEGRAKNLEESNPELTALRESYDSAKDAYEKHAEQQPQNIQNARDNLAHNQEQLNNIKQEIAKRESNKEASKYAPNGAVVDYAKTFLGDSEKDVENALNTSLPDGLWCAAFVNRMLTGTYGKENLPEWYNKCNTNSCSDVYGAANKNGAAFTDASQAQAGDMIFFNTSRGNCRHIGFVTKVDYDKGIVYTIEGNTSSHVGERQYSINGGKIFGFARV